MRASHHATRKKLNAYASADLHLSEIDARRRDRGMAACFMAMVMVAKADPTPVSLAATNQALQEELHVSSYAKLQAAQPTRALKSTVDSIKATKFEVRMQALASQNQHTDVTVGEAAGACRPCLRACAKRREAQCLVVSRPADDVQLGLGRVSR